jgi:predicted AlkP superfamily phosphohydrolase/phosphomutase
MALAMNSSTKPRQLIIGLDAMEWHLVRAWAAAGKLPTFRRLLEEGTQAVLSTPADRLPDTVWTCLCSGLNPAHLARFFYVQHDPDTGGMRYLPDDSFRVNYVWNHLSEAGRRVGVVDAPHVSAGEPLNGFHISWGTHGAQGPRFSAPASLLREVDQRFGRHPVGECDSATSEGARKSLRRRLLEGVKAHGELFRECITDRDWEVLIAVFGEPHCGGHFFWQDTDSTQLREPANHAQQAGTLEEIYRAIDREVGAMIEAAGPGVLVYAVSAHGMGPLRHASWNLADMLDYWGYGSKSNHAQGAEKPRQGSVNFWRILRMVVPGKLQYATYAGLPQRLRNELVFRFYRGNRSWEQCRAFAVPNNDSVGAIRINLKGRDHHGIVEPGIEYEQICDDLCAALAELKDPVSGKPVVVYISRIQRELRGPYLDRLPDITVQWEQSFAWSSVHSPRFGTMQLRDQDSRSGSHTAHGFLLATGDGIRRGATITGASIYDLVPSIMDTAGVSSPAACEGRPLFRE